MIKLLKYLKKYRKESIIGPLFKLLEASLELAVPLIVAAIIDNGIVNSNKGYTAKMALLLGAAGLVGYLFSIMAQYFAAKASVGFVTDLRHALFRQIQSFSYSELDKTGTSTLITRLTSDMNQVQSGVNITLRLLLRSPFVVFGSMVMAFTINYKAALIFAVAIPVLAIVVFGIMLVSIPLYKKVQSRLDTVLGITRDNLTGVRVIRAFCKEDDEKRQFKKENLSLTKAQIFVGRISALMNPVTYVIINAAIIWLIYRGAIEVSLGVITQGAVVALYNYMSQILVELIKLASFIINLTKSVASGNRIEAVLEMPAEEKLPSKALENTMLNSEIESAEVEFRNVSFKYDGAGDDSLKNISFKVSPGETVAIIGGTGSGKTTLVNLIPAFYKPTSGEVLINGISIIDLQNSDLRAKISIVPQKAVLFKGTIRKNMLWGNKDATDSEIINALKTAEALEIVEAKPGKLDAKVEQNGKNFSGGQRQRLTIARALVKKPEILIMDDSFSALDFATDARLRKGIKSISHKPTVFIVSQRTSSIINADKILVLDDGELAGAGTHNELLKTCPIYKEIYNSQLQGGKANE